jgi:hypothetical protein
MDIVTAGVHNPRLARGVFESRALGNGEGIHVRANGDEPIVGATDQLANDARSAHRFLNDETAAREDARNIGSRLVFLTAQFGVGVDVTANFNQARGEFFGEVFNLGKHEVVTIDT